MIQCSVCGKENHHLTVVCRAYGSYLQSKIDNLDLFTTMWQIIESPQKAFYKVAIATHKNYIVFLSGIFGIALAFAVMWWLKVGDSDISLLQILSAGFVLGPVFGILTALVLGVIQKIVGKLFRLQSSYKNVFAIVSYACIPLVLSVFFILPIEILTFGKYFFSTNPPTYTLKPLPYFVMIGLDGLSVSWSVVLYLVGTKVLYNVRLGKAAMISGLTLAIYTAILYSSMYTLTKLDDPSTDRSHTTLVEHIP